MSIIESVKNVIAEVGKKIGEANTPAPQPKPAPVEKANNEANIFNNENSNDTNLAQPQKKNRQEENIFDFNKETFIKDIKAKKISPQKDEKKKSEIELNSLIQQELEELFDNVVKKIAEGCTEIDEINLEKLDDLDIEDINATNKDETEIKDEIIRKIGIETPMGRKEYDISPSEITYNGETFHSFTNQADFDDIMTTFFNQSDDGYRITQEGKEYNGEEGIRMYNQSNAVRDRNGQIVKVGDMASQCKNIAYTFCTMISGQSTVDFSNLENLYPQITKQWTQDGLLFYINNTLESHGRKNGLDRAKAEVGKQIDAGHPPALQVQMRDGKYHWICAIGYNDDDILVLDTEDGKPKTLSELGMKWTGTFESTCQPITQEAKNAIASARKKEDYSEEVFSEWIKNRTNTAMYKNAYKKTARLIKEYINKYNNEWITQFINV